MAKLIKGYVNVIVEVEVEDDGRSELTDQVYDAAREILPSGNTVVIESTFVTNPEDFEVE